MNWGFLENVLSGVNKYSTVVGRVWLSVLFVFRILVFVAAAEQVWKDEFKDFVCNTQQPGCEQVCFDHFFPISQVRLWALQLIMVSTPSLLVALHVAYREHRERKHRRRLYRDKGSIDGGLLLTYIASLLIKTSCEVASLLAFYFLYSGFHVPRLLRCNESPCPNTVDCYIARATEKKLFLYIMGCTSILCIALNMLEIAYIVFHQCWKCFSRRYVPVEGSVRPSSAFSLGSPAPLAVSKDGCHQLPLSSSKDKGHQSLEPLSGSRDGGYQLLPSSSRDGVHQFPLSSFKDGGHQLPLSSSRDGGHQLPLSSSRDGGHQLPLSGSRDGGHQLPLSGSRDGGRQLPLSSSRDGGHQLPLSGSRDGGHQLPLSGSRDGGHQLPLSGSRDGGHQLPLSGSRDGGHQLPLSGSRNEDSQSALAGTEKLMLIAA